MMPRRRNVHVVQRSFGSLFIIFLSLICECKVSCGNVPDANRELEHLLCVIHYKGTKNALYLAGPSKMNMQRSCAYFDLTTGLGFYRGEGKHFLKDLVVPFIIRIIFEHLQNASWPFILASLHHNNPFGFDVFEVFPCLAWINFLTAFPSMSSIKALWLIVVMLFINLTT